MSTESLETQVAVVSRDVDQLTRMQLDQSKSLEKLDTKLDALDDKFEKQIDMGNENALKYTDKFARIEERANQLSIRVSENYTNIQNEMDKRFKTFKEERDNETKSRRWYTGVVVAIASAIASVISSFIVLLMHG